MAIVLKIPANSKYEEMKMTDARERFPIFFEALKDVDPDDWYESDDEMNTLSAIRFYPDHNLLEVFDLVYNGDNFFWRPDGTYLGMLSVTDEDMDDEENYTIVSED